MKDKRAAVRHLKRSDPVLAELIAEVGPCTLEPDASQTPFQALVRAIVYQQLNGTAAATILGRVLNLYPGGRYPEPDELLATPEDRLRGAGLSRAKTAALRDLAGRAIAGKVPGHDEIAGMADEAIVEALCEIRGVGRWTAEMLLIFKLGRMDVLPATDFGVRHGFALRYRKRALPEPRALLEHGARWAPYRTIAAWYLWRAVDLHRARAAKEPRVVANAKKTARSKRRTRAGRGESTRGAK